MNYNFVISSIINKAAITFTVILIFEVNLFQNSNQSTPNKTSVGFKSNPKLNLRQTKSRLSNLGDFNRTLGHANPVLWIEDIYEGVGAQTKLRLQLNENIQKNSIIIQNIFSRLKKDWNNITSANDKLNKLVVWMKEEFIKTGRRMDSAFAAVKLEIKQINDKLERLGVVVKENREAAGQDLRANGIETVLIDQKRAVAERRVLDTVKIIIGLYPNPLDATSKAYALIKDINFDNQ